MEALVAAGRLRAPKIVLDELSRIDDACSKWAKAQTELFMEESLAVQRIVKALMATHTNANAQKKGKGINGGDPFVIAMAKDGGAHWVVVSDEHAGSAENRKIPYVCSQERVRCIRFQTMMIEEGWQFR
jgi:NAD(P)H-hydrate repair Nnr-like enzyme with NAD(P)H-hydrate epimerase domain